MSKPKISERLTTGYFPNDPLKYFDPKYLSLARNATDIWRMDFLLARAWSNPTYSRIIADELHTQLDSTVVPETIVEVQHLTEKTFINSVHTVEFNVGINSVLNLINKRLSEINLIKDENFLVRKSYYIYSFCFVIINSKRVVELLNLENIDTMIVDCMDRLLNIMEEMEYGYCRKYFINLALEPEHRLQNRITKAMQEVIEIFIKIFKGD